MRFLLRATLVFLLLVPESALAAGSRPFWTEKSAFIEGEDLFVVGVATKTRSAEEGRQQAFQHGKVELMNYAQVMNLEAKGLVIETQMTYEEIDLDGSVTVFRLLRVPVEKLREIQGRLQAQSKAQELALEQTRRELSTIQETLTKKQRELDMKAREMEETMKTISLLQVAIGEKALKIEQQQRRVEEVLNQVSARLQVATIDGNKLEAPNRSSSLLKDKLDQAEAALDAEERELQNLMTRAQDRILKQSQGVQAKCKYLQNGMTKSEVKAIMGAPDSGLVIWYYGTKEPVQIYFNDAGGIYSIQGCHSRR